MVDIKAPRKITNVLLKKSSESNGRRDMKKYKSAKWLIIRSFLKAYRGVRIKSLKRNLIKTNDVILKAK